MCNYLHHRSFDCTEDVVQLVEEVTSLQIALLPQAQAMTGRHIRLTQIPRLNLQRFEHPGDKALALARWLHETELGDVAALVAVE